MIFRLLTVLVVVVVVMMLFSTQDFSGSAETSVVDEEAMFTDEDGGCFSLQRQPSFVISSDSEWEDNFRVRLVAVSTCSGSSSAGFESSRTVLLANAFLEDVEGGKGEVEGG